MHASHLITLLLLQDSGTICDNDCCIAMSNQCQVPFTCKFVGACYILVILVYVLIFLIRLRHCFLMTDRVTFR